ncbi:hypothetical protein EYF80_049788 [Liparis tanakae]|uniref:Uncharacterized protein n=1 Tax=Liparis tanakae TaxID=230148 RepID=A0A4Z2FH07_9TELE|nr:hypothetical protein EYF80_049788 [Liparis tanakae]
MIYYKFYFIFYSMFYSMFYFMIYFMIYYMIYMIYYMFYYMFYYMICSPMTHGILSPLFSPRRILLTHLCLLLVIDAEEIAQCVGLKRIRFRPERFPKDLPLVSYISTPQ